MTRDMGDAYIHQEVVDEHDRAMVYRPSRQRPDAELRELSQLTLRTTISYVPAPSVLVIGEFNNFRNIDSGRRNL